MASIIKAYNLNKIEIDGFFYSGPPSADNGYISHEAAVNLNYALEFTDSPVRIGPAFSSKGEIITGFRRDTFLPAVYVPHDQVPTTQRHVDLISLRKALGRLEKKLT